MLLLRRALGRYASLPNRNDGGVALEALDFDDQGLVSERGLPHRGHVELCHADEARRETMDAALARAMHDLATDPELAKVLGGGPRTALVP